MQLLAALRMQRAWRQRMTVFKLFGNQPQKRPTPCVHPKEKSVVGHKPCTHETTHEAPSLDEDKPYWMQGGAEAWAAGVAGLTTAALKDAAESLGVVSVVNPPCISRACGVDSVLALFCASPAMRSLSADAFAIR